MNVLGESSLGGAISRVERKRPGGPSSSRDGRVVAVGMVAIAHVTHKVNTKVLPVICTLHAWRTCSQPLRRERRGSCSRPTTRSGVDPTAPILMSELRVFIGPAGVVISRGGEEQWHDGPTVPIVSVAGLRSSSPGSMDTDGLRLLQPPADGPHVWQSRSEAELCAELSNCPTWERTRFGPIRGAFARALTSTKPTQLRVATTHAPPRREGVKWLRPHHG